VLNLFLIVGAITIIISGILIGSWTDGQQQRANFHSETESHRNFRTKSAMILGLVGITSFGVAGALYFL